VLEEPNPQIGSRRSQTPLVMVHEEGQGMTSEDERAFRKDFYDMSEMVKVLYNERETRLQGEIQNHPKIMVVMGESLQLCLLLHLHLHLHPHLLHIRDLVLLHLQNDMLSLL